VGWNFFLPQAQIVLGSEVDRSPEKLNAIAVFKDALFFDVI
jgi:hypothetical protein